MISNIFNGDKVAHSGMSVIGGSYCISVLAKAIIIEYNY
jgi:hypothetical protein